MARRTRRPRLTVLGLLLALVVVTPWRAPYAAAAAGAPLDTLVIGMNVEVKTLDQGAGSIPEITMGENIFETLLTRNLDGTVGPNLSPDWQVSADARIWTFHLRRGVRFHNGEPFNAGAVKFSVDWIRDPKVLTQFKAYYADLDRIEIVDEYTVRFHFKRAFPLLAQLLPWHLPILPPKYVSEHRDTWGRRPVGTGPYKFVEWIPNERIVMDANAEYWGGRPLFKRLVFRPIPDETARTAALLSREVQIVGPLSLDQAPMVAGAKGVRVAWSDSLLRERIQVRWDKKPFDDIRVRQAVAYAVNRTGIIKNILGGQARAIYGPIVRSEWGFSPKLNDPYPYNPARARQLLAEAGYPNGLEVDYAYAIGITPKNAETAQAIASDLAAVGIRLKLLPTEWGKFIQLQTSHMMTPLSQSMWQGGGTFHAWHAFHVLLHCKVSSDLWNPKKPQPYWCDPRVDDLADQASELVMADPQKALRLFADAQEMAARDVYQVWLWQYREPWGVSARVEFHPAPSSDIRIFQQARPAHTSRVHPTGVGPD